MSEILNWEWAIATIKNLGYSIRWRNGGAEIYPTPEDKHIDTVRENFQFLKPNIVDAVNLMVSISHWCQQGNPVDRWRQIHRVIKDNYAFMPNQLTYQDTLVRWAANKHSYALSKFNDSYHRKVNDKLTEEIPECLMLDLKTSEALAKKIAPKTEAERLAAPMTNVEDLVKRFATDEGITE